MCAVASCGQIREDKHDCFLVSYMYLSMLASLKPSLVFYLSLEGYLLEAADFQLVYSTCSVPLALDIVRIQSCHN